MPYSIVKDDECFLVIGRLAGVVDENTYTAYFDEIEALAPFDARYNLVLILDATIDWLVPTEMVREYALRVQTFNDDALRIIVASTSVSHGLSRVFSSTVKGVGDQYRLVRNLEEAATLLKIEESKIVSAADKGKLD